MSRVTLKLAGITAVTIAAGVICIATMLATTPKRLGPNGVTFWFIDVLFLVVGLICLGLVAVKIGLFHGKENLNKTVNSSFRTAFLFGVGSVTILALRSLGTLSIKDVILLGLVLILIEFYLRTRGKNRD